MADTEVLLAPQVGVQRSLRVYGGLSCNTLMAGKVTLRSEFIEKRPFVPSESGSDRSPLHDAAFQGRPLSLRTLLTQGFPADLRSLDGVTALHEACLAGHAPCTRLLLEHGATVEAESSDGATPLLNACRRGSAACVRLLLGHGPAVPTNQLLAGAVHEAAGRGHRECLELLLASGGAVEAALPGRGTPLYAACLGGATACVESLLLAGTALRHADPTQPLTPRACLLRAEVSGAAGGSSPLHAAVAAGAGPVVELLMAYGADGSARNAEGDTALELAAAAMRTTLGRGPASLAQFCRLSVRRRLGRSRLSSASRLPLPPSLKDFLLPQ
ncbi:ankyrin repeat and SOCS box protein 11 [Gadus macrocephalus]|uniref:ankyrin repeat and SOCS box protein 11 n=1 Tax=Gadus macrocephalus TaxID=80720 RepID=UPI0028CB4B6A|nr:ankyrin repeat and SOCS box protein 11 [Gadus macrocephalus]